MKTPLILSTIALLLAIASFAISLNSPSRLTDADVEAKVDEALRARERAIVEEFAPNFRVMFAEMGDGPGSEENWNPKNLEELFAPMVKIVQAMQE